MGIEYVSLGMPHAGDTGGVYVLCIWGVQQMGVDELFTSFASFQKDSAIMNFNLNCHIL